jgi:RHS repeat-associated protein
MDEIGLYHYGARFYDPAIAHFISADTIVPSAGNVLDWNRYAYVRYNPLKLTDPSGHNPECGPDGMWCDSAGNLIQFQKLQLVNFKKYFGESKELEIIFSKTIASYEFIRQELFNILGTYAVDSSGKIGDNFLISIMVYGEFSSYSTDSVIFSEALEAISMMYYSTGSTTPCGGSCSLNQQINWLQNIEAFRGKSEEIINEYGWLNYLESATFAMNPNYKGKGDNMRQSWMWGNYDTNSYLDLMIKEGNGKGDLYLFVDQT